MHPILIYAKSICRNALQINYYTPANEPDFIEVGDGLAWHLFTVLSPRTVRFSGFGGEKCKGEPMLPNDVASVFTENGITVLH